MTTYFHKDDVVRIKNLADHPDKKNVDVEYRIESVRKDRVRVHPKTGCYSYFGDISTHGESPDNLILIRRKTK